MYGTSRAVVDSALQNGTDLILEVDVNGALAIKKVYPDESATVFIHPPSLDVLKNRLRKRGVDSEERIEESDIDQAVTEIAIKLEQMNGGPNRVN